MAEEPTRGPKLGGGMMHEGLKSAPRVPMGVSLPRENMNEGAVRTKVGQDAPTIGPRTA